MPKLTHLTFLISLFLIFLLPPTDPDLGWHLRCGQEIWQGQGFCGQNHFTVLLEDYSWPNHAWGYQAIIYPVFKFFGFYGLTVLNALLMTTAFGFLFAAYRCGSTKSSSALQCALAILATIYFGWGVFSFGLRSQLMGFFFFTLTLYLLTVILTPSRAEGEGSLANARRSNTRKTYPLYATLLLTMLLWSNTHGSVILGLILIGVFSLTTIVGKLKDIRTLLITTVVSAIITFINPFVFRIYEEMWRHFAGPIDLSKLIAEWVPPVPRVQQLVVISGVVVLAYLLSAAVRSSKVYFAFPSLLLIPIFTFWGLKARRNVPFFFVILSYSLLNSLKPKISPLRNQLTALLTIGVLLYGLIVQLPQTIETNSSWQNYCQNKSLVLPCEAVEFLKKQPVGDIFNRYEWGGFLIWQLPEHKIFVDGRMPSWLVPRSFSEGGPASEVVSPYTIYLHTLQNRPGWQETLDQYNITYILISPNPGEFGWQEIYRDKIAVVYKRL